MKSKWWRLGQSIGLAGHSWTYWGFSGIFMPKALTCSSTNRAHQQGLDTSTPSGKAMFQMLGVFAEFERAMIRERVLAGLARARADGKQLGRRPVEQSKARKVKAALALRSRGVGIRRIARDVGLGVGTVLRVVGSGPN